MNNAIDEDVRDTKVPLIRNSIDAHGHNMRDRHTDRQASCFCPHQHCFSFNQSINLPSIRTNEVFVHLALLHS